MTIYDTLGVAVLINAKGPATRLSGGLLRAEAVQAMAEASQHCVDIAHLQAAASEVIAEVTGAEAGYVASGAAACLLLGTAAAVAGLDCARMARLPDTSEMKSDVVMVRSQRNFYDHAVRAAGVRIVEVGLPDRYAGSGVRDAEAWEIEAAITPSTAAVVYLANARSRPPLREVVEVAHRHGIPVIVDAAAQLPPQANLRRFIAEGADLVAFSGGKAIGGPQASGILCGRRDLVMSVALQHLDLDVFPELWEPPASLIDTNQLRGVPQHGIGRTCKAGKEEIAGLVAALRAFVAEGDAHRHARWLAICREILSLLPPLPGVSLSVTGEANETAVPMVEISLECGRFDAMSVCLALQRGTPPVAVDPVKRDENKLVINPMCLRAEDAPRLADALVAAMRPSA